MSKKPPSIRKEFCEVVKFGVKRTDPFRWLRDDQWQKVLQDPSSLAPEIKEHLEAENDYFKDAAKEFAPFTEAAAREIKSRLKPQDTPLRERDGDFEYWSEYRPGGNYRVYKQRNVVTGVERTLLDGDKEAAGRKFFDAGLAPSPDHKIAAYVVDHEGAGNYSVRFRDIETGTDLPDILTGTKGQGVWSPCSSFVYYIECDDRNIAKRVKRHVIGADPKEDETVYEETTEGRSIALRQSQSGDYVFIETREGAAITVETRFVGFSDTASILVQPHQQGLEYQVEHRGDDFYIRTNAGGAVDGKIVKAPVKSPGIENWVDVAAHKKGTVITDLLTFRNFMVRKELQGTFQRIVVSDYEGHEYAADFPVEPASLSLHPGRAFDAKSLTVECQTPANPGETYTLDLSSGEKTLLEKIRLPNGHNPEDYIVERKFVKSRDGESDIPVTILRHKSTKTDGSSPLYLYAYGAYGGGLAPDFSSAAISLADRGVIYAIAHVHGGNEKGLDWYHQGRKEHKWNSFHDFIDVAESLTDIGYGKKGKIVMEGRSAGGLLVGAVLNERPDLFAAAIAGEAFLDVLNTMDDSSLPWVQEEKAEWGDPDDEKSYRYMGSYSPYDNISKTKKYPPVLATTGVCDPCVMYWEPAKWIARLRDEAQGGPFFLRSNTDSGHEGSSARLDNIDETAVEIGFALHWFQKCGYDLALKTGSNPAPRSPAP